MSNFELEQELTSAFNKEPSEDTVAPSLSLYVTPICPYCIFVRSAIAKLGLDVEIRNIYSKEHFDDLVAARNRATVPVLRISYPNEGNELKKEKWLPESSDIIEYLKELKANS